MEREMINVQVVDCAGELAVTQMSPCPFCSEFMTLEEDPVFIEVDGVISLGHRDCAPHRAEEVGHEDGQGKAEQENDG